MRHALRPAIAILALTFSVSACKKDQPTEKPTPDAPIQETQPKEQEPAAKDPPPPHSSSIPGTENQLMVDQQIPEVSLDITGPEDGAVLDSGDFDITFDVKNYRTGREIGQHVHVIVDNEPYIAHYAADEPLEITGLSEGTHTIRAFPARHYHLSLKEGEPFDIHTIHVGKKSESTFDKTKPYLTYSRPKGTYSVDAAKNLLLDYYVQNAEIGKDAKVVYMIDGESKVELTEWKPVLIGPLEAGEHEITLQLVDMEGTLIANGGYNDTTRKITVE